MTGTPALDAVVAEHLVGVNAYDEDAIVATFADDALVNDAHREFRGVEAIRRWVAKEMVGDRTNLPDEIILTNYFTVRDGKIVTLIVIRNTAPSY
jgi:hypothetical protein